MIFLVYSFAFGHNTTVHVKDTYTFQSRDVDKVPYGVAIAASFMSRVAHEITEKL